MTVTTESTIEITPEALERIRELRTAETIPDLHLGIAIVGVGANGFLYETSFLRSADVSKGDLVEMHDDLPVAIPPDSVESLAGSVLDIAGDPASRPGPAQPERSVAHDRRRRHRVDRRRGKNAFASCSMNTSTPPLPRTEEWPHW